MFVSSLEHIEHCKLVYPHSTHIITPSNGHVLNILTIVFFMFSVHGEMLQIFAAQRGQRGMFNDALVKQPCDIL